MAIGILLIGTPLRAEYNHTGGPQSLRNQIVAAKDYPWSAIGKLNNGVGGSCTAVLISRNYALTAAHCLFFRNTGHFLPAQSLHLIFGYENQQFSDHLRVSAYHVPAAYEPLSPYETLANDWALLSISGEQLASHPLDISQQHNFTSASMLMTAGYSHLTPYVMTADRHCSLVGRSHDGSILFDSCQAPLGFSGGPVLVANADKHSFSVAGIHVGNQMWRGKSIAIAVSSEAIWREIKPCVVNRECQFQFAATGRDPTAAELLSNLPLLGFRNPFGFLSNPFCATDDSRCAAALTGP